MKLNPGEIEPNLQRQFKVFGSKHTWVMSIIYTMTFGSFIGYSAGFALAIKVIFGFTHTIGADGKLINALNPNGPSALMYAWMGPFIGALIRPVGGWVADKAGGAKVTQIVSIVMIAAALGAAYYMKSAYQSATPEQYFMRFHPVPDPVRRLGHWQRFHLPYHRHRVPEGAGRPGSGLDFRGRRLWRVHHPAGIRRADPSGHTGKCAVRIRHLLRRVPAVELVVLPRPEG